MNDILVKKYLIFEYKNQIFSESNVHILHEIKKYGHQRWTHTIIFNKASAYDRKIDQSHASVFH